MPTEYERLDILRQKIRQLISILGAEDDSNYPKLKEVHPQYKQSASNLLHYRLLRSLDLREIQTELGYLGLSRLAKAEGHILESLCRTENILTRLMGLSDSISCYSDVSISESEELLEQHMMYLMGPNHNSRRVRIMVTLPSEAANQPELVEKLVALGMDCARINCAHDSTKEWKKMVRHIRQSNKKLGKSCKVSMDLGGPKIRTGAILPGPKVRKFRVKRNESGEAIRPVELLLVEKLTPESPENALPVQGLQFEKLEIGGFLTLKDNRNRKRKLTIKEISPEGVLVESTKSIFTATGNELTYTHEGIKEKGKVGELPAAERFLLLRKGDRLRLFKGDELGWPAEFDQAGQITKEAAISCTFDEVFDFINPDERIFFDDGKIGGIIRETHKNGCWVEITSANETGSKLRADKGINLPDSSLSFSGLTAKDKEDLKFVVKHADIVNASFINSADDVRQLVEEMQRLEDPRQMGIILKIETQAAYHNLTEILIEGMKTAPVGVMIARGDLAIETGWENMGRIQHEILGLCNAAHVPVIWATQVLENLAKKGIPSRSEITDATASLQSECVMLNKGPHITRAMRLLDSILQNMEEYQHKNAPMLPAMEKV